MTGTRTTPTSSTATHNPFAWSKDERLWPSWAFVVCPGCSEPMVVTAEPREMCPLCRIHLDWTPTPHGAGATVSWLRGSAWHRSTGRRALTRREASSTPPAFRDVLIGMARSAYVTAKRETSA
jgi:hypothetical protein